MAPEKSVIVNHDILRDIYRNQTIAFPKTGFFYHLQFLGKPYLLYIFAGAETRAGNDFNTIGNSYIFKARTISKCRIHFAETARKLCTFQRETMLKNTTFNKLYGVGKRNFRKRSAIRKSTCFNSFQAIRKCHGRKRSTIIERRSSYLLE